MHKGSVEDCCGPGACGRPNTSNSPRTAPPKVHIGITSAPRTALLTRKPKWPSPVRHQGRGSSRASAIGKALSWISLTRLEARIHTAATGQPIRQSARATTQAVTIRCAVWDRSVRSPPSSATKV